MQKIFISLEQIVYCVLQTDLTKVLVKSDPYLLFEEAGKRRRGHMEVLADRVQREIVLEICIYVSCHCVDLFGSLQD